MIGRLGVLKMFLWAAIGVLAVATLARFTHGSGATTNLSDAAPWGLWIAFNVMAGVALAAGGFVLTAAVYIFGLERYRPFVRPAILTAFLGYIAMATGLLYDLELPWRIWHTLIFPQHHSVLFEVAVCVMLYLTVLGLEFAPVALEHRLFGHAFFRLILSILRKTTILLVIAGVVLSTLHQSSLGSLFLIAPYRVHELWYSPIIYVLFFISAIALGLMVVTIESLLSAYFFGHKIRKDLLSGLSGAAAVTLALYAVLRLGDLAVRGVLGKAFDGSWQGLWFLFEILLSAIVPAALLAMPRVRKSLGGIAVCSTMTVIGMVLYRLDVCVITFSRPEGTTYWPSWIEVAVSVGIVSGAALVFIFFVENLKVYGDDDDHQAPSPKRNFDPVSLHSAARRYSMVFVLAAAVAVAALPEDAMFGPQPVRTPVASAQAVDAFARQKPDGVGNYYVLADLAGEAASRSVPVEMLMIDGNRDGRFVLFPHESHAARLGETSCVRCHHQNMPADENTACSQCHSDMYETTDIFVHALHVEELDGNEGCAECHVDHSAPKTRQTSRACLECHADMHPAGAKVSKRASKLAGLASGYHKAMHERCIGCHKKNVARNPNLARCDACHAIMDGSSLQELAPRPSQSRILKSDE